MKIRRRGQRSRNLWPKEENILVFSRRATGDICARLNSKSVSMTQGFSVVSLLSGYSLLTSSLKSISTACRPFPSILIIHSWNCDRLEPEMSEVFLRYLWFFIDEKVRCVNVMEKVAGADSPPFSQDEERKESRDRMRLSCWGRYPPPLLSVHWCSYIDCRESSSSESYTQVSRFSQRSKFGYGLERWTPLTDITWWRASANPAAVPIPIQLTRGNSLTAGSLYGTES